MIQIDPEFKNLIPPLSPEEYAQLEANIKADGCRDPIVLWNDFIIDGHNRHEICTKHGIKFWCIRKRLESREEAILWIIGNQIGRRNLEAIDKVPLLERKREILARKANDRKAHGMTAPGKIVEGANAIVMEVRWNGQWHNIEDQSRTVANCITGFYNYVFKNPFKNHETIH